MAGPVHITSLTVPSDDFVVIQLDRHTLYKRRWRAKAGNGDELAVDLDSPAIDGDFLLGDPTTYKIEQTPEEVVIIPLPKSYKTSAQLGWFLGNQHLPIEVLENELLVELTPTLPKSLERIGIPHKIETRVFHCKYHSHRH